MYVCVQGHCDFDFMIMLEASYYNFDDTYWQIIISAVGTLLDIIDSNSKLGETSRVGIIQFSHEKAVEVELSENKTRAEIDPSTFVPLGGGSHLYYRLLLANSTLKNNTRFVGGSRIPATQGVIVFSDGRYGGYKDSSVLPAMKQMMDDGIHIILIGKSYLNHTMQSLNDSQWKTQ